MKKIKTENKILKKKRKITNFIKKKIEIQK